MNVWQAWKGMRWNKTSFIRLTIYLILLIIGCIFFVPFLTMLFNAFKAESEILGYPPTFIPRRVTWDNYTAVLANDSLNILNSLKNSVWVTIVRTALTLYFSVLWGYVLAKINFKGRRLFFYMVLSTMMVPVSVILLPLYQEMGWFGLHGSLLSLIIVVNSTTSYAVFIMKQFISTIPRDIIEAAKIDGCSEFQITHRIVFPLIRNAVSAISIIVFLYVWNEFLWPYMMLDDSSKYTITIAMQFLNGRNFVRYGQLMAAASISLLPIIVVYFLFQNKFVEGISMGGVKE